MSECLKQTNKQTKAKMDEKQQYRERQRAHCLERNCYYDDFLVCCIVFKGLFLGMRYHR